MIVGIDIKLNISQVYIRFHTYSVFQKETIKTMLILDLLVV